MASKFKLIADPTFKMAVPIPIPGGEAIPVTFTFKHHTRIELAQFRVDIQATKNGAGMLDEDMIKRMCAGWDLEDEFNDANVLTFVQNHVGATAAVGEVFFDEHFGLRKKAA